MPPIIDARALIKRFGTTCALDQLDLVVEPGEVVALLGPNGAGKTTFVRTVATLVRPDSGTLRVNGFDVTRDDRKARSLIGLAGQHAAVEPAMTGRENLVMVARLYGQGRKHAAASAARMLDQLGLADAGDRLVRGYSGGMRRRLDLGASLVGAPRLLLLDEPTTGLDPRSRFELWDAIRAMAADGTDVLLTTQYLDEADQLAGRIVIIDHGRVIADGSPAELKSRAGHDVIEVHASDTAAAARVLQRLGTGEAVIDEVTRRVSVGTRDGSRHLAAAIRLLEEGGVALDDIALRRPTLDEVFLTLTGQPSTAAA
jgi:ABC-2 type transport system ATP-binding protein